MPDSFVSLAGVLPFRIDHAGVVQVLLVTNAKGAWIVPKGSIGKGMSPQGAALQEAWEESGAHGYIAGGSMGCWRTLKRRGGQELPARATLYPMIVEELAGAWPEDHRRNRRWASIREATELVQDDDLKQALHRLARHVRSLIRRQAA
jgi:8-oxo-dGTP pyrophosphatase MutT (NUDIX family)